MTITAPCKIDVDASVVAMAGEKTRTWVLVIKARSTAAPDKTSPRPVDEYTLTASALAPQLNHDYQHGEHQLVYLLGEVTRELVQETCDRIAESGAVPRAFAVEVEPGVYPFARVVDASEIDELVRAEARQAIADMETKPGGTTTNL